MTLAKAIEIDGVDDHLGGFGFDAVSSRPEPGQTVAVGILDILGEKKS